MRTQPLLAYPARGDLVDKSGTLNFESSNFAPKFKTVAMQQQAARERRGGRLLRPRRTSAVRYGVKARPSGLHVCKRGASSAEEHASKGPQSLPSGARRFIILDKLAM